MDKTGIVTCDRCEEIYDSEQYNKCPKCNSTLKRVKWEKKKEWVSKNMAVVATLKYNSEDILLPSFTNFYYNSKEDSLKRNKVTFQNQEQLESALLKLKIILEFIGWKSKIRYLESIKEGQEKRGEMDIEISKLINQYPTSLINILKNFSPEIISEESNLNLLKELIKNLNEGIFKTEEHVKISFKRLLNKISNQNEKGMDELRELLETNTLLELTSVSRILMSRLNTIEMFENMAYDEKIYEIKGDNSIQNFLERNMWLLNENWWLVQANKGMKKFIGDEIEKKEASKRPDFVCVTFENKLIIVDIKKPNHSINKSDIDQVENYKLIAKKYRGENFNSIQCFLIGKKIPSNSRLIANERKNIELRTYNDLVESVKKKYINYLEELKKAREREKHD